MKQFLDTSILVKSCLSQSPKFAAADALVRRSTPSMFLISNMLLQI